MTSETYTVVQVQGGKFHRPAQTTHARMDWFKPMLTTCGRTITPINVFPTEAETLSYCGGNDTHLCRTCFP